MSRRATSLVPIRPVETLIRVIRGHKVILDADLAALYKTETRALNQAVQRNPGRFPETFMFRLTPDEAVALRSQIVILDNGRGRHSKYAPLAFTEHGVVMLSAVLKSRRAIEMSILVVNTFVRIRQLIATNKDFAARVEKLERVQGRIASVIEVIMEDLDRVGEEVKRMQAPPEARKRRIGFPAPTTEARSPSSKRRSG